MSPFTHWRDYVDPLAGEDEMAWRQEAEAVTLPRISNVGAAVRPQEIGSSYAELEYQARAEEQLSLWPAEGERAARPHRIREKGLAAAAAGTEFLLEESATAVRQANADFQHAVRTLSPYVRREPGAKLRYWLGLAVLWLGDTAGVSSAAITNGDLVFIAVLLGLASGMAAVCAGLVGIEVRDRRLAHVRAQDAKSLSPDEQRYRRLFIAPAGGTWVVRLIGLASLTVVALLAIGVGTLRASIEGSAAGTTFGLLAAAVAVSSGLLGYATADEVADLLTRLEARVHRAERHHLELASSRALADRAEAAATAQSLSEEYRFRAQAAAQHMEALSFLVQRNNPNILGHGYPAGDYSGAIGRRPRRDGAA